MALLRSRTGTSSAPTSIAVRVRLAELPDTSWICLSVGASTKGEWLHNSARGPRHR